MLRLDPHPTKVGDLPAAVNALAYSPDQDLYYGVSGAEIVTITPDGLLTWPGTTSAGPRNAFAGTIAETHWLLMGTGELLIVDIAPASPTYLAVVRRVRLSHPPRLADWDISPTDGALYAVDTGGTGSGSVVRIDPDTGVVTALSSPEKLPGTGDYGSVVIDAESTMHALHNPTGVMFHLPLADPTVVTATPIGPPARVTDGARCPAARPGPTPSPSMPTPSPTSASPSPPLPAPPPSPPPPVVTAPAPSPTPSPSQVLVFAQASPRQGPERRHPVRIFFLGMLLPALIVAARGVRRARR